jgi:hypothetical protein
VELDLAPYESRVLVFSDELLPARAPARQTRAPIDISSGWALTFPDSRPMAMPHLGSWTDLRDRNYFPAWRHTNE